MKPSLLELMSSTKNLQYLDPGHIRGRPSETRQYHRDVFQAMRADIQFLKVRPGKRIEPGHALERHERQRHKANENKFPLQNSLFSKRAWDNNMQTAV